MTAPTVTAYRTGGNNPYRQLHKVRCDQCPDYTTTPALIDDAHDERSRHLGLHANERAGAVVREVDSPDLDAERAAFEADLRMDGATDFTKDTAIEWSRE